MKCYFYLFSIIFFILMLNISVYAYVAPNYYDIDSTLKTGYTANSYTNIISIFGSDEVVDFPPQWSNNQSSINNANFISYFNVTWTDDVDINGFNSSIFQLGKPNGNLTNYTALRFPQNISHYNMTLPIHGIYNWTVYANDSIDNWNITNTWEFTVISDPPSWFANATKISSPATYNATETYGWQINWTDMNNDFSNSTFQLGTAKGTLINYTSLTTPQVSNSSALYWINITQIQMGGVGTYNITWFGIDLDSKENKSDTVSYVIQQNSANLMDFYITNSTNITFFGNITEKYPEETNTSASMVYEQSGTLNLYYDDIEQNSRNGINITLGVKLYKITANTSGNVNYTANSTTYYLNILQNPSNPINIEFYNTTDYYSNQDVISEFGIQTIANGTGTAGTVTLFRNKTAVSNPDNQNYLGIGTYEYKANTSGSVNITANITGITFYLKIQDTKAPQWIANDTSLKTPTYNVVNNYGFQINWTDPSFDNSTFQLGTATGTLTNYTILTTPSTANDSTGGKNTWYINFTQDKIGKAGTYNFTWFGIDVLGHENSSDTISYVISKNTTALKLAINGTENDVTQAYPYSTNVTGWNCLSVLTCNLYKNDSLITNPDEKFYGVIVYNFTYNTSGNENYSSYEIYRILTITRGDGSSYLNVYIDDIEADKSVIYPVIPKITGNHTTFVGNNDLTYELYKDDVQYGTGDSVTENQRLANAIYVYKYGFAEGANWSASNSSTRTLEILKGYVQPALTVTPSNIEKYPKTTTATCSVTSQNSEVSCILSRDEIEKSNPEIIILGVGKYIYRSSAITTANYTANATGQTITLTINKDIPVIIMSNTTNKLNTSGLVGYWSFSSFNTTNYTFDKSGYDNDGNVGDSNATQAPQYVSGKYGKGFEFDGIDDYINCGINSSLNLSSRFTIEAWVYPTSSGTKRRIIFGEGSYTLWIRDDNLARFEDTYGNNIISNITILPNNWYHLVGVFSGIVGNTLDSSVIKFYVNGVSNGTNISGIWSSTGLTEFRIGSKPDTNQFFNGTIDEVKIWNRVLSAEEIKMSYNSGKYYPYTSNVSASVNNTEQTLNLYRYENTSIVDNNDTVKLKVGKYYYIANVSSTQNYTNLEFLIPFEILKNTTNLMKLYLNGTEGDRTYEDGEIANLTAELGIVGKTIYMFIGIDNSTKSGVTTITNLTNLTSFPLDSYNITAYWNGDENYSVSKQTWYLSVSEINIEVSYPEDTYQYKVNATSNNGTFQPHNQTSIVPMFKVSSNTTGTIDIVAYWNETLNSCMNHYLSQNNSLEMSIDYNVTNTTAITVVTNLGANLTQNLWSFMIYNNCTAGTEFHRMLWFEGV